METSSMLACWQGATDPSYEHAWARPAPADLKPSHDTNLGQGPSWEGFWGCLGAWLAVLDRLGSSWGRLGPFKNRCQNRSKNRCPSRSTFDAIWMDFGKENGSKLGPGWGGKSILS